jgi:hypothetical protein
MIRREWMAATSKTARSRYTSSRPGPPSIITGDTGENEMHQSDQSIFRYVPYFWLIRIPLATASLLAWMGVFGRRHPMFRGLFDVPARQLFWPSLLTVFLAFSIGLSADAVFSYGSWRYIAPDLSENPVVCKGRYCFYWHSILTGILSAAAALPLLSALWRGSSGRRGQKAVGIGTAVLVALALALAVLYNLADPSVFLNRALAKAFSWSPEGYVAPETTCFPRLDCFSKGDLWGQLSPIFVVIFCSLLVYICIGWLSWRRVIQPTLRERLLTSGLSTLLLFSIWANSLISALAFFWDRFLLPSSVILLTFVLILNTARRRHARFDVHTVMNTDAPAERVLQAGKSDSAIVITAAGGGIQMSAWTARVLSGLVDQFGDSFAGRVRMVSGVSGGSVGALYFLASYEDGLISKHRAGRMFESATRSSLDYVAWGMAYPDLMRLFFPFVPKGIDRGWALERAWSRDWSFPIGMDGWRQSALAGEMPAIAFNTTVPETGEHIAIATSDLKSGFAGSPRRTFRDVYPELDMSPVTAARLSATFPWVTPAAAPAGKDGQLHFVDGGYSDNYGTAWLAQWLDEAVRPDGSCPVRRILILRIASQDAASSVDPGSRRLGWLLYQAAAPFKAFWNVRTASQASRQRVELKLLAESLKMRGVNLTEVAFLCRMSDPPLSWHLDEEEIGSINQSWERLAGQVDAVRTFLAGAKPLAVSNECG